ncbi:MAG: hypothetical protein LR015_04440 [Verrucomicrobia bacterium]|nr:hypothetical protein [Verrucomicrobiota bacterium]
MILGKHRGVLSMLWLCGCIASASEETFVFEGMVETAAAELAPEIRNGLVLAGAFSVLSEAQSVLDAESTDFSRRYSGMISRVSFSLDVDFRIVMEAEKRSDEAWLEVRPGNRDSGTDDVVSLMFPIVSIEFAANEWQPLWLELFFYGRAGTMLRDNSLPNLDLAMDSGWFRIAFTNEQQERWLFAEGPLTAYGPEGEPLTLEEQVLMWQSAVDQLHLRLADMEQERDQLRADLRAARDRIAGLHQMVDTLMQEKQFMQREVEELRSNQLLDDHAIAEERAQWQVEQAMLTSANEQLRRTNMGLAEALVDVEREGRALRRKIAEMEDRLAGQELSL